MSGEVEKEAQIPLPPASLDKSTSQQSAQSLRERLTMLMNVAFIVLCGALLLAELLKLGSIAHRALMGEPPASNVAIFVPNGFSLITNSSSTGLGLRIL